MVSDRQVRKVIALMQTEKTKELAADKAGMSEKTARRYLKPGKMPSEILPVHTRRTREDPFTEVWEEPRGMLSECSGFEAKTLLEYLQRRSPGTFGDGQLRTLQRRVKRWRALEGPAQEVFFPQLYLPGEFCASDFTHMSDLGVTAGSVSEELTWANGMTDSVREVTVTPVDLSVYDELLESAEVTS